MAVWSIVNFLQLPSDLRIDAEYYQPKYLDIDSQLSKLKCDFLEDLATDVRTGPFGSNLPKENYINDGVIVLRPFNIKEVSCEAENIVFISPETVKRQGLRLCHPTDLAFARVGDIRCGVIPDYGKPITISPNIIVASLKKNKIDPYFLAVFMNTRLGFFQMERAMKVVAQPTITVETIKSILIPETPLEKQLKIKKSFELSIQRRKEANNLYSEAEAVLLNELGLDTLDLSTQKTYIANFSETLASERLDTDYLNPKYTKLIAHLEKIPHNTLSNLATLSNGATPKGANYLGEGIPFLRIQNVNKNRLELDDVVYISEEIHKGSLKRSQLKPRDVLITITGRIGTAAVIPDNLQTANMNQHSVRLRLKDKQVNPYYLSVFLNSKAGLLQSERESYGATREALPYYCLERLIIPIVSSELQEKIESKIRNAERTLQEAKNLLEQAKLQVEQMIFGEHQPISSQSPPSTPYPLRGTPIQYTDPTQPVAQHDWDTLQ